MPRDWPSPDDKPVSRWELWLAAALTVAGPAGLLLWLFS